LKFDSPLCNQLRQSALSLPQTSEGSSCVNRAFKVGSKNFLFAGEKDGQVKIMLRLFDSVAQAEALDDQRIKVGKFGWVTIRFAADDPPDSGLVEQWVLESYRGFAPKKILKELDAR
jgi:hypothetical protein